MIQAQPARLSKKMLNPTGEPQLNHEPHERQCFLDVSYQRSSSSFVIFDIRRLLLVNSESLLLRLRVNVYS